MGNTRQLHATRRPGAVQSGEFDSRCEERGRLKRAHAGQFSSGDARLCVAASGQCREQNERHVCGRNHPQALQREDGGTLQESPSEREICLQL